MEYDFDYSWAQNGPNLIAHAFGGIDGNTYTNSLEAFQKNYQQGHRIFEVDFSLTVPENTLVATHAGMEIEDSYAEFMDRKILDNYTALDYRDVIDLMVEYPDIYIVTDTKFVDKPSVQLAFAQLVRYANATDATVLDRIVPQIYHENMLQWVMEVYPFASIIYTLYQTVWTPENVSDFCEETNVGFVTIEKGIVTQEIIDQWKAQGIIVACFTENDQEVAANLFGWGADFIYTDFLLPSDFE